MDDDVFAGQHGSRVAAAALTWQLLLMLHIIRFCCAWIQVDTRNARLTVSTG